MLPLPKPINPPTRGPKKKLLPGGLNSRPPFTSITPVKAETSNGGVTSKSVVDQRNPPPIPRKGVNPLVIMNAGGATGSEANGNPPKYGNGALLAVSIIV